MSLPEPSPRKPDVLPIVVLLGIVGLAVAVIWLFPYAQSLVQHQNCVGLGEWIAARCVLPG